ncbi:hypothetical protein BGW36DRAFT_423777 [Talaromyces proteolyticus]|uniref:Non-classical export protein 1 n=1 Tax=Talaromyces proteolyticus TaxID=1131652 RepID=A0AAD4Q5K1_9EURO|nr:uncharacterized protein BGW36DRAFT_423777 [Talaromyces proteolyticus]KAH8704256.1 hypothetical protein BGW36DRAFT_423777 [Talaromyces proteolyticus]
MSHPFLISKIADPIFALAIGASSAVIRIQRDHRTQAIQNGEEDAQKFGLKKVLETGSRRAKMWWNGDFRGL